HTNFKLRSDEKLALVSPTGDFIDIVDTQELLPNQSFGRRELTCLTDDTCDLRGDVFCILNGFIQSSHPCKEMN
ncbi:MAG: hypothetical protein VXV73_03420, partial [Actinomycetota bacterium]|nr:hypothetical protein [Actinomycetota bacterium]